jgi:hypothetical protein
MNKEDLEKARTNKDFLNYLKDREDEAIHSQNLELLYEVLDSLLILNLDEERINKIYETILISAFSTLENRLSDDEKLDLFSDDIYLLRALYEHGVQKWSNDDFQGAKEIFFILSRLVLDKKFSRAVKVHLIACSKKMNMDDFNVNFINSKTSSHEVYGYFLTDFKIDTKNYIEENKDILGDILSELGHLLNL